MYQDSHVNYDKNKVLNYPSNNEAHKKSVVEIQNKTLENYDFNNVNEREPVQDMK
jgi:hypothetical protein